VISTEGDDHVEGSTRQQGSEEAEEVEKSAGTRQDARVWRVDADSDPCGAAPGEAVARVIAAVAPAPVTAGRGEAAPLGPVDVGRITVPVSRADAIPGSDS
jgi:hypothetical protein